MTVQMGFVEGRWHQNWANTDLILFSVVARKLVKKMIFLVKCSVPEICQWEKLLGLVPTESFLTHSGFRKRVWFEFPSHHFSSEYLGSKFSFHYCFRSRPFPGIIVSKSRSRLLRTSFFLSFPFTDSITEWVTGSLFELSWFRFPKFMKTVLSGDGQLNCFCYWDEI